MFFSHPYKIILLIDMAYERNFSLLNSKFKELFFPTLIASIAGNFAVLADAFFISLFMGPMFLSVVQSIEPLVTFINVLYWLIGLGGSILCTMARAEFDEEKSNTLFTVSIISMIIIALAITASAFLFSDAYLNALCHSAHIMPLVEEYFFWYVIGIPCTCYMICLAYFIRTDGFISLQFRAFLINNVVNVVFNAILLKFVGLGVAGAAIATSLGAIVSAIYITTYFFSPRRSLRFIKVKTSEILGTLAEVSKAGFSGASIPLYISLKLLVLNALVTTLLGDMGLSAFNMCYNTTFLVSIFVFGTTQSLLPIVAIYYKEGDYHGVEYVVKRSFKLVLIFGSFFSVLFAIYPQAILFLFSVSDPADIPFIMEAVRIFAISILAYSINFLYIFYTQAVQYNKISNAVTLIEGFIFPVLFAYLLTGIWGPSGFWVAFIVSECATLLFIFILSKYINRKSNNEYSGFFLIKETDSHSTLEFTIDGSKESAKDLAGEVHEFLSDSYASDDVSLALEEMLSHIIDINETIDLIDVIIKDKPDAMVISMKYSGVGYNPIEDEDKDADLMELLDSIADNIEYSQILGLNNTVVTINH